MDGATENCFFGLQDFTLDKAIKQVILLDDNVEYILIFPPLGRTDLLVRIIELLRFLQSTLLHYIEFELGRVIKTCLN